jgi:hypothetical protein
MLQRATAELEAVVGAGNGGSSEPNSLLANSSGVDATPACEAGLGISFEPVPPSTLPQSFERICGLLSRVEKEEDVDIVYAAERY